MRDSLQAFKLRVTDGRDGRVAQSRKDTGREGSALLHLQERACLLVALLLGAGHGCVAPLSLRDPGAHQCQIQIALPGIARAPLWLEQQKVLSSESALMRGQADNPLC